LVKEGDSMNRGKIAGAITMSNLRLNPPQPVAVPAERNVRPRHAAITHDFYSYRLGKHWMNNLRPAWDKS
jgi:hypothetical protein